MEPLLEISHVNYSYHSMQGETPALTNVHFHVDPGTFVAIVGPSGCGKSTLLSLIAGLLEPEHGEIRLEGKLVNRQSQTPVGYMLQKDHLFEWRTIWKNILLGLEIQKNIGAQSIAYANSLLKNYGLYDFKDKRPSELSGGMRQRAALIRTLVLQPSLLLLDEPFSALDYQTRLKVADDIGIIIKKEAKTAILVTHDLSEAVSLADQVIVLSQRPAQIETVIPLDFEKKLTPFERRDTPQFKDYFNTIWRELNHDE
jgi:NitT/TauT family transport system ATP-binding protein